MGVLDKFIYELLPYTKTIDVKDELVIYDHADGKTKRVRVESLVTDNDFDFPWDSETVYAKNKVVSFGGDLWESRESGNLGNMPVEGQWWTKLNKVVGSTVVEYRPGAYGKGLVIVHYPYAGSIAAYAGVKLWELVVPEGDRPFNSTNIVAEIEAVDGLGDPAPKWVPVHPVGGGTYPGDLTAFVAKNKAGTDIVLTPSEPSRWGNILSEGKATLIAFLDYIGSRLGQIGDKDVDATSRADGRFLKYDVLAGKYVHAEVEEGEGGEETPESIKTKYESNEDTNAFTDSEKSKLSGVATGSTKNTDTDELDEGTENKYFTEARAIGSKLAGYVKAVSVTAISSTTSILQAIGILEKALDGKVDKVAGSGLITDAEKLIFADKYTKSETDNLVSGAIASLIWKDDVANFADLATEYPDAIEGWTSVVNSENKIYRFDGTNWIPIGDITIPMATESVDGKMSKENFVKLRDIEAEATKNDSTDELDEGTTNKYFTEARAVAAMIAGYVKAGTSIPLSETDSILQALGKLERGLDDRLRISGDNFIATRPTSDMYTNGVQLQNIIYSLEGFMPGDQPLSNTNRVHVLVFPGEYQQNTFYLNSPYVDIIGFGSKNGIILNGNIDAYGNEDHRIENLTIIGGVDCYSHTEVCVYRNLTVGGFFCNTLGTFENIEHIDIGGGGYLFETLYGGILKNIYTPQALGSYVSLDFKGIIEDCRVEAQHESIGISGVITRSYFRGFNDEAIIELRDGAEISYSTVINDSNASYSLVWAVTNYKRHGAPDTDKYVKIHHCRFEAKDGALNPKVINTIANGHNTWDVEGDTIGLRVGTSLILSGALDVTGLDIVDVVLTEDSIITSIQGARLGGLMIRINPSGFSLNWSEALINPLNIYGDAFDKDEQMLAYLLITSTSPLLFSINYEVNHLPSIPPPDAPTNLTSQAISSGRVDLEWVDNSADETGFEIERSTDGVNFTLLESVGANETTFIDIDVSPLTQYWYRVSAVNNNGKSSYSNITDTTTPDVEEVWYLVSTGTATDPALDNPTLGVLEGLPIENLKNTEGISSNYKVEVTSRFTTVVNGSPAYTTGNNSGDVSDITLGSAVSYTDTSSPAIITISGFDVSEEVKVEIISSHTSTNGRIVAWLNSDSPVELTTFQAVTFQTVGTAVANSNGEVTLNILKSSNVATQALLQAFRFKVV